MARNSADNGLRTMESLMQTHPLAFTRRDGPFDGEDGCARHAARIAYTAGLHGIEDDDERFLPVLDALLTEPIGGGASRAGDAAFHRKDLYVNDVTGEMIAEATDDKVGLGELKRKPVAGLWTILNQRGVLAVVWSPFGRMDAGQSVSEVKVDWRHDPRTSFFASQDEEIDRIEGFEALLNDEGADDADVELRSLQLDALGAWQRRAEDEVRACGLDVEWLQYVVSEGDGIAWRTIYDTHARQLRKAVDPENIHTLMAVGRPEEVEAMIAEGREELKKGKRDFLDRWKRHGRSRHAIVRAGHTINAMVRADMLPQDLLDALGVTQEGKRSRLERVLAHAEQHRGMLPTRPGYID